jgi:hypothetical protein
MSMKQHKLFRAALLVSIQERHELFPELTDGDIKALRTIGGEFQSRATRRRQAEKHKENMKQWAEIMSRPKGPVSDGLRLRRQRQPRDEPTMRAQAEEALRRSREWEQQRARREAQARAEKAEREAQRELSLEITAAGYRLLAVKHHPDKGGSSEAMARLTRARDHLKRMS